MKDASARNICSSSTAFELGDGAPSEYFSLEILKAPLLGPGIVFCISFLHFRAARLSFSLVAFGAETSILASDLGFTELRMEALQQGVASRTQLAVGDLSSSFKGAAVTNVKTAPGNGAKACPPLVCTATSSIAEQKGVESSLADVEADGRVFNFAAGPATLPAKVVKQAQEELFNWRGSGMSVMEMSHRGKEFTSIIQKAEKDLRELLKIPENYDVLFLQGGASTQFSAIPLNLAGPEDVVDYIVTGTVSLNAVPISVITWKNFFLFGSVVACGLSIVEFRRFCWNFSCLEVYKSLPIFSSVLDL